MKRVTLLAIVLVCVFSGLGIAATDHKFIGVSACKMCHKGATKGSQFETWEASKHAKAMETLKSEAAAKVAKEKGLKLPASEAPECVKCHMTGFGEAPAMLDAKFDPNMGVQCESCHGAGSDYKGIAVMKDRTKAIAAGLNPISAEDGTAEKHCVKCHNAESPFFKGFNFKEAWAKIQHPLPAAK